MAEIQEQPAPVAAIWLTLTSAQEDSSLMNEEAKSKAHVLADVCSRLAVGSDGDAIKIMHEKYRFVAFQNTGRSCTTEQALRIFLRDSFQDRYTGTALVFPGTLRILSIRLPEDFPYHPHWKLGACHIAFYELFPTVDHVIPVARGGKDNETNWVTTSMVKNASKANFLLEELGWQPYSGELLNSWDGLTSWFSEELVRSPSLLDDAYIRRWNIALQKVRNKVYTHRVENR